MASDRYSKAVDNHIKDPELQELVKEVFKGQPESLWSSSHRLIIETRNAEAVVEVAKQTNRVYWLILIVACLQATATIVAALLD
jgi:hypothetical protein